MDLKEARVYDLFISNHTEFVLRSAVISGLSDEVFQIAGNLVADTMDHPKLWTINTRGSIKAYLLLLESWLTDRQFQSFNSFDSLLIESLLLNRAGKLLTLADETGLIHACIGAMIQKRLTLLLSSVNKSQWARIHGLHKMRGVEKDLWKKHLAGAGASAYVINRLASREHSRIFPATIEEDLTMGIDLFWNESPWRIAISVKCTTGNQIYPVHVRKDMTEIAHSETTLSLLKNVNGLEKKYLEPFEPVVIYVGNQNGGMLSDTTFTPQWDETLFRKIWRENKALHIVSN